MQPRKEAQHGRKHHQGEDCGVCQDRRCPHACGVVERIQCRTESLLREITDPEEACRILAERARKAEPARDVIE